MKKARIQDIAQAAGVSPATVTRVLRGTGYASSEKRELVLQAAKALNYHFPQYPAEEAIPQVLIFSPPARPQYNWLFPSISETICMEFQKVGWYCITCCAVDRNLNNMVHLIDSFHSINLKGVIFNCLDFSDDLSAFRKLLTSLSTPVLMIERFPDIFGLNKIMINAKEAVFLAVKYLYKRGHRHISFFCPDSQREVEISRINGFHCAVQAMGLEGSARFMPIPNYTKTDGLKVMEEYTLRYGLPTAVIAADPVMAGVSQYLYERKLRVPQDVSLVGLDDTIAGIMTPALTSIAFPVEEIAQNTVQLFTEAREKMHLSKTISLSTYLIERDTVAAPRAT